MMQSPFSPFVHRVRSVKDFKTRRQSEVKSDLIDWDAPEIPELDKQRIIYEEFIKECNEDHAIEMLINEELYQIAHEVYVDTTQKQHDEILTRERSQVNLLLGQVKMFEAHSLELENTIKELESQNADLESKGESLESRLEESDKKLKETQELIQGLEEQIKELEGRLEELDDHNKELDFQNKELELRNKELEADLCTQIETFVSKKAEAEDLKRKWESAKNQLSYYKKLSKKVPS